MLTELNSRELVAKIRDVVIDTTKAAVRDITGSDLREDAQKQLRDRATNAAWSLVDTAVRVVAGGDLPAVTLVLEDASLKGAVKLKGNDLTDDIGSLAKRKGAEVVLVLASAADFDHRRPPVVIVPDQTSLLDEGDEEEEGDDEAQADHVDDVGGIDAAAGPFFSAVEVGEAPGVGGPVALWTILHGDVELFDALAAGSEVQALADDLNATAEGLGRNLSPFEVREVVLGAITKDFAPSLKGAYTTEAIQAASLPQPANDQGEASGAKRGPKTAAEKAKACNEGWDAAKSGKPASECPYKGTLKEQWEHGHKLHTDGSPRPFVDAAQPPANDDGRESSGNVAA